MSSSSRVEGPFLDPSSHEDGVQNVVRQRHVSEDWILSISSVETTNPAHLSPCTVRCNSVCVMAGLLQYRLGVSVEAEISSSPVSP